MVLKRLALLVLRMGCALRRNVHGAGAHGLFHCRETEIGVSPNLLTFASLSLRVRKADSVLVK